MRQALEMALETLEEFGEHYDWCHQFPTYAFPENYPPCNCGYDEAITAIKEALAQTQEPVEHAVIAGALFDFMGWLTSRKERIVLSSADEASPAVNAITDFAKMRGLSLNDAKVQDWNTTPPQRTWVGLMDDELPPLAGDNGKYMDLQQVRRFYKRIEAKLKEKNT